MKYDMPAAEAWSHRPGLYTQLYMYVCVCVYICVCVCEREKCMALWEYRLSV